MRSTCIKYQRALRVSSGIYEMKNSFSLDFLMRSSRLVVCGIRGLLIVWYMISWGVVLISRWRLCVEGILMVCCVWRYWLMGLEVLSIRCFRWVGGFLVKYVSLYISNFKAFFRGCKMGAWSQLSYCWSRVSKESDIKSAVGRRYISAPLYALTMSPTLTSLVGVRLELWRSGWQVRRYVIIIFNSSCANNA